MNLKMIVTQLHMLPDAAINRTINGVIYPLRNYYLREVGKETPNMNGIVTARAIEKAALDEVPSGKVHTLDSTALFVFGVTEKQPSKDEAELAKINEAKRQLLRDIAEKRIQAPRSKAELDKLMTLKVQQMEDRAAVNMGKASDAVQFIETLADDDGRYDEAELPEYVTESLIAKVIDAGVATYKDAQRRLARAKFEFQEVEPRAAMEGALALLRHFDVKAEDIDRVEENARVEAAELFERLSSDDTPKEKKARAKEDRAKQAGISSADMAAANGVK